MDKTNTLSNQKVFLSFLPTNPSPWLQAPVLPQRHWARVLQPHAQVAEARRTAGGHAAKEEAHHAAGDDVAWFFLEDGGGFTLDIICMYRYLCWYLSLYLFLSIM
jgi:hypothetical protein